VWGYGSRTTLALSTRPPSPLRPRRTYPRESSGSTVSSTQTVTTCPYPAGGTRPCTGPTLRRPGGTTCTGTSQAPYAGPVPIVTHLHGAHVTPESDGNPEAWFLPAAKNIPSGYATRGSHWDQIAGAADEQGTATFQDPNDQAATTLWYHDHALGMTRTNVYAGLARFLSHKGRALRSS